MWMWPPDDETTRRGLEAFGFWGFTIRSIACIILAFLTVAGVMLLIDDVLNLI